MYRGLTLLVIGVFWWNLDMLYIMLIAFFNFHSESQGSNSKNDRFIKEKRFLQSLHCLCFHNSAIKAQKCTKIRDDVPKLSVKRSWKFHQVFSKNYGDVRLGANYTKIKTKGHILLNTVPYSKQFVLRNAAQCTTLSLYHMECKQKYASFIMIRWFRKKRISPSVFEITW